MREWGRQGEMEGGHGEEGSHACSRAMEAQSASDQHACAFSRAVLRKDPLTPLSPPSPPSCFPGCMCSLMTAWC